MQNSTDRKLTAAVTGAAGVLGIAVTKAFLSRGLQVVMMDNNRKKLEELRGIFGLSVYPCPCDISNPDELEEAYSEVCRETGPADILVNNAGILTNNKSETTSVEEWRRVMEVNLNGVFFLSRLVIPAMKEKGWGRIINTSSLAAKTGGITAGTAYSTSKGAVMSLTFSLAAELAPYGITVNGIAPAYVKTPMVTEQLTEEQRRILIEKIPVGRFCEPEEFAHVVCFLADDLSGFITGEIIDQNGGLLFD